MSHMHIESDRFKTFCNWPVSFIDKHKMSRAGFFYDGDGSDDKVQCFKCNVQVVNWERDDEPDVEHVKWSNNCSYILTMAGIKSGPKHPNFAPIQNRVSTFEDWPISLPVKGIHLAEAGFYYEGSGDKCCCYYCGSILKHWMPGDDPWEEHARWNENCEFLRTMKGNEYINEIKSKFENKTIENKTIDKNEVEEKFRNMNLDDVPTSSIEDSKLCKICFSDISIICFVPCGHVLTCPKCAYEVTSCPTCRCKIEKRVRLYFS